MPSKKVNAIVLFLAMQLMPAATGADTTPTNNAAADVDTATHDPPDAKQETGSAPADGKMLWHPGESISIDATTEDIIPTYDVQLAEKQVAAYPDSPEASFILAVALTRTSRVEEALKEVQRARKLAEKQGGANYFDKMIASYEKMLVAYPQENKVRYGLAWAYYMKAYLLSRQSRHVAAWKAANPQLAALVEAQQKQAAGAGGATAPGSSGATPTGPSGATTTPGSPAATAGSVGGTATGGAAAAAGSAAASAVSSVKLKNPSATARGANDTQTNKAAAAVNQFAKENSASQQVVQALPLHGSPAAAAAALSQIATTVSSNGKPPSLDKIPHIPGALEKVDPADIPQIKAYFEKALQKLDEILKREPDDVWTIVYQAHLRAEYTGNLESAMQVWRKVANKHPNNPAAYFFLGEGYLKQGNLKESINNVSRAIALRALGN